VAKVLGTAIATASAGVNSNAAETTAVLPMDAAGTVAMTQRKKSLDLLEANLAVHLLNPVMRVLGTAIATASAVVDSDAAETIAVLPMDAAGTVATTQVRRLAWGP